MKITILGPAHPYRGGLASIMEIMARTFQRRGNEVDIKTFTLQYPSLLFPGKSQTVSTPPPADLHICRCVNTVNPFNWVRIGRRICRERPDFVLMKYWTPFMAPCFGTIARFARRNGHTKVLCQIDNVEPHEHHLTDKPFNRYYLGVVDGFVYMSEQVHGELKAYSDAPALFSPHPLFENFGERVARNEACVRLGLDPTVDYVLFFGLIRDYKGLDLLLDAWAELRRRGLAAGRRLIVAGEFYTPKERYLRQIADNGLQDEVILHEGLPVHVHHVPVKMAKDHVFDSIERLHQVLSLVHGVQKLRRRSEHERIRVRVEAHGRGNCAERFCPLAGFFQQRAMADVDPIEKSQRDNTSFVQAFVTSKKLLIVVRTVFSTLPKSKNSPVIL